MNEADAAPLTLLAAAEKDVYRLWHAAPGRGEGAYVADRGPCGLAADTRDAAAALRVRLSPRAANNRGTDAGDQFVLAAAGERKGFVSFSSNGDWLYAGYDDERKAMTVKLLPLRG